MANVIGSYLTKRSKISYAKAYKSRLCAAKHLPKEIRYAVYNDFILIMDLARFAPSYASALAEVGTKRLVMAESR